MTDSISNFFSAIKKGDLIEITTMLDDSPALASARDEQGSSAVLTAAYYQQPAIATLLVKRGASLTLFEACAAGSLEHAQSLLRSQPAQINEFAPDGFQPIGLAAFFGHTQVVETLLNSGSEVDTPSRNGLKVSPLNSAAAAGRLEITRLLLEHGANPNLPQSDDFVPLHAAAQNGQREMAQLLLQYGADKTLKTGQGKTALDIAIENGHPDLADLLV